MGNKENSSRITPANYMAIFAMALLALFTFFGVMYGTEDGEIGIAIIFTLVEIILLSSLLVLSIKAKSETNHFKIWRIVEYCSLVVYLIVAILFISPLLKYFYVMSEKDNLKETALTEIAAIESLYTTYDHEMEAATKVAIEQMTNYLNSHSISSTLEAYIDSMEIDRHDVPQWGNNVRDTWRLAPDASLAEIKDQIESWGFFDIKIAQVGKSLERKGAETVELLNSKVKSNQNAGVLPIIRNNGSGYCTDGLIEPTFSVPETGEFHMALRYGEKATALGWIAAILLHILILFNYLVSEGRFIVGPGSSRRKKGQSTNGIDL